MTTMSASSGARAATRRGAVPFLVAGLVAVGAAAVTGGVVLHVANRGLAVPDHVTAWWLMQATAAVSFGATGAWLLLHRPRLVVGWLLLGIGLAQAVAFCAMEYGVRALLDAGPGAFGSGALWLAAWLWAASLVSVAAVLPMLLPDGRLPSPAWRLALAVAVTAVVAQALWWALAPYDSWAPGLHAAGARNPVGTPAVLAEAVQVPGTVLTLGSVGASLAALVARWRASSGDQRAQLKWVLYGITLALLLYAAGFALGPPVTALAMVPLPVACLVAATRHGMWDVDAVISRSLVYGLLTATLLAASVAVVGVAGAVLGRTTGAPIVATALLAVLAEPLLRRLRALVNRIVYGERDDPYAVLSRLGARLEAAQDAVAVTERVLPDVVAAVAGSLRLPYVAVTLADGSSVAHGTPTDRVEATPLTYAGEQVGRLVVGPGPGGLRRKDRRLLGELAGQAAVAVRTVLLTRELGRSREALVTAREEERRRLYRELHDGLGPSLAALALQVETARDLLAEDPGRASAVLDRVLPRLTGTVGDVRQVVTGLRPPALDDLGLDGALRELAGRFATASLQVSVHAAGLAGLPAAVEVAAYRIVAEALANAARHAQASQVQVHVERLADVVQVRVTDDGRGLGDTAPRGIGLPSMRARALELGGTFAAGARPAGAGTVVTARLPVGVHR